MFSAASNLDVVAVSKTFFLDLSDEFLTNDKNTYLLTYFLLLRSIYNNVAFLFIRKMPILFPISNCQIF